MKLNCLRNKLYFQITSEMCLRKTFTHINHFENNLYCKSTRAMIYTSKSPRKGVRTYLVLTANMLKRTMK